MDQLLTGILIQVKENNFERFLLNFALSDYRTKTWINPSAYKFLIFQPTIMII